MEVLFLGSKVQSENHPEKDERIKERDKAISYVKRQVENDPEDGEILRFSKGDATPFGFTLGS